MHPYLRIDLKYNTNYYNYFIKNKQLNNNFKTKKKYKKQRGGIIYNSNNKINSFDIKYDKGDEYSPDRLFIGGSKYGCFIGLIDEYNSNEIIIQNFSYDKRCNTKQNLRNGLGMKNLMETLIKYVKDNLIDIKIFRLTDKAMLECISDYDNKKHNIILSHLYFLKYMNTYYQDKYNFKFEDNNMNIIIKDNINLYKSYLLKKKEFIKYLDGINIELKTILNKDIELFFKDNIQLDYKIISRKLKNGKYDCLFLELWIDYTFKDCKLQNLFGKELILEL